MNRPAAKVLIAIPCLLRGGTEVQTLQLVRALSADGGFSVAVVCYFERDAGVVEEFETSGAEVRCLGLPRSTSAMKLVRILCAEFRSHRAGLVHVQYLAPGLLPVLAARLAGYRAILATVHQPGRTRGWRAKMLLHCAVRLCRRFVCVSQSVERSWFGSANPYSPGSLPQGLAHHCTIYNGVDLGRIESIIEGADRMAMRRNLGFGREAVIGVISRLSREKGIDILLEAMPGILREAPETRVLIVGDGPERSALERQAQALGLDQTSRIPCGKTVSTPAQSSTGGGPHLVWVGRQSWESCIEFASAMDLVVAPSRFEGFGFGAAEAMGCEKPVVAARLDGLEELLGQESAGTLFVPESPADLKLKLLPFLRDPGLRASAGRKGRERIRRLFSLESYREKVLSLHREAFGGTIPSARGL